MSTVIMNSIPASVGSSEEGGSIDGFVQNGYRSDSTFHFILTLCGSTATIPSSRARRLTQRPRIALYQPDIAGNAGTILRLAVCLGLGVEIIEPAGFDMSDRALRRAGMDYLEMAALTRHLDFARFEDWRRAEGRRLILFSTKADRPYTSFDFAEQDVLLFGRESSGVPDSVHEVADARLLIPMPGGGRSLNIALAVAMAAGEVTRQLG
jgi:tRNA (cytidine/uridine-2'-O-)-methyltransferase